MSRSERAKKNIASKIAGSKTGRTVIVQSLGNDGANLVQSVKDIVELRSGHQAAKDCKANIFKFALKAKIMADGGYFTAENTAVLGPLILKYSQRVVRTIRPAAEEKKADTPPPTDYAALAKEHADISDELVKLMSPKMQDKNIDLLKDTLASICSEDFFRAICEDSKYEEPKLEFYNNLSKLLESAGDPFPDHQVITSQSVFSDQYSSAIRTVRSFWLKVVEREDEVGMSIFNKLVEKHKEYYDLLGDCLDGDDPMKQHKRLIEVISQIFRLLDSWPLLVEKLKAVGAKHEDWAPGVSVGGYGHVVDAIHAACTDSFGKDYSRMTQQRFNSIFVLLVQILREAY